MKKGKTLIGEIERIQNLPPKQYQQGWTEFYKLKFKLTPDVLIPRPETEILVEETIKEASKDQLTTIFDIGTGSGCIAVSIAKNLPEARIVAIDISPKALKIAEQNAKFHKVEKRIIFLEADLLTFIPAAGTNPRPKAPDIIVTNLPYIPTARLMFIDPMVKDFEPLLALDGGIDGFELYRRLFKQMNEKKFYPKVFIGELDDEHHHFALQEAKKYFPTAKAELVLDLAKVNRFLKITF